MSLGRFAAARRAVCATVCVLGCVLSSGVLSAPVTGAGSTAAAALYKYWGAEWGQKSGIKLAYEGVGSSAGLKAIQEGRVDFGASDVAPSVEDMERGGLICFPTAISGIVPVVNLPGVPHGALRLSGAVLAEVMAGRVTRWNAPAIAALNRDLHLPDQPIRLVAREDGSGTTYVLSHYLSRASSSWRVDQGANFKLKWPASALLVKGTGGMLEAVGKTAWSIGYAEFGPTEKAGLSYARVANSRGEFPVPGPDSFRAALSGSAWTSAGKFEEMLTDMPGQDAWPITGGTFVIMRKLAQDPARVGNALSMFSFGFMNGDKAAAGLGWIPLPELTQARAIREMNKLRTPAGKPLAWKINY